MKLTVILTNIECFLQSIGDIFLSIEDYVNSMYLEFYSSYPSLTKLTLASFALAIASLPFVITSIGIGSKMRKNNE